MTARPGRRRGTSPRRSGARTTPLVFGAFVVLAVLAAVLAAGMAFQRGVLGPAATASSDDELVTTPLEAAELAALFARPPAAPLLTSGGAATVTTRDGPALALPDGRLVAGDVFGLGERAAFGETLPPGATQVTLLVATFAEDERVAAVLFGAPGGLAGLTWTDAVPVGEPPLGPGETSVFPVDSGTAGFTSAAATTILATDAGYGDRVLEALEGVEFAQPVRFPIDDARTLDVLAIPSGWGDGAYPTWSGADAGGATVAFLTSFDVLDRPAS